VPGTQVFLADDGAASALTEKRKWWHAAQQLWVRTAPHRSSGMLRQSADNASSCAGDSHCG
jgi:hypothetical protein